MNKLFVLFTIIAFLSLGSTAIAPPLMYDVTLAGGYIYDDETGLGIPGADVSVLCVESGKTMTDTTDPNGYYLVTIQCSPGNTIQVSASADSKSGSAAGQVIWFGSVIMDMTLINVGVSYVNVTIPEFPITALPAVLSMLSFGLVRRRLF